MIQIKHLASVLPPVCCCHTGDLEDARIQADKQLSAAEKQIFSKYFKNLTAWGYQGITSQIWGLMSQPDVCVIQ